MIPPRISGLVAGSPPGHASGGVPGEPVNRVSGNPGVATRPNKPPVGWNYQEDNGPHVGPNQGPYLPGYGEPGGFGAGQGPDREPKQPGNNYGGDIPEGH